MRSGHVTVLQINDTHGYLEPHPELVCQERTATYPTLGGYATMAEYCREVRAERHGAVILLDNGDTFHGTHPVVQSKGGDPAVAGGARRRTSSAPSRPIRLRRWVAI